VMAGRTGPPDSSGRYPNIVYLPCTEENGFMPEPPREQVDVVYLCSPNNPTGATASASDLAAWVRYARENGAILLYDAAYESFIREDGIPHSIFEVEGARECAIEFRSYSKLAGFTGLRCAYVVVPRELQGTDRNGEPVSVQRLWARRQSTKFNGASYPIQVGAAAVYTKEGQVEIRAQNEYYMENARIILDALDDLGIRVFGGVNAPYVWLKTPDGMGSWEFFDRLLEKAHVVGTPGAGFGACGEGYFRLSAFAKREDVEEAVERIRTRMG